MKQLFVRKQHKCNTMSDKDSLFVQSVANILSDTMAPNYGIKFLKILKIVTTKIVLKRN